MPKKFYTEKDIEDLFRSGVKSLQITGDVVLTELAYEKARSLGFQLLTDSPENPPSAPVRPYLSQGQAARPKPETRPAHPAVPSSQPPAPDTSAIEQRIRSAVLAKLSGQVDTKLLDTIIHRVVRSTGLK